MAQQDIARAENEEVLTAHRMCGRGRKKKSKEGARRAEKLSGAMNHRFLRMNSAL
jgi:hypothetical protein